MTQITSALSIFAPAGVLGIARQPRIEHDSLAAGRADDERGVPEPGDRETRHGPLVYTIEEGWPLLPLNFIRGRKKRSDPGELPRQPKPDWLKVRAPGSENYHRLKGLMRGLGLHTVCEEANCPNIGECWHHGTATFMILGSTCTRSCGYCNVTHGTPLPPDEQEPVKVASAIHALALNYVVVTSVDRDDLPDFGATHFARTIAETRARIPECRLEVLIPDFQGDEAALRIVLDAKPDVLNHNIETVPRLYRIARPGGRYPRALEVLQPHETTSRRRSPRSPD